MVAAWPSVLPQYVLQQGFTEALPDVSIQTSMEAGPPKSRRRFTGAGSVFTIAVAFDFDQRDDFDTFYNVTLRGGSLPFTWVHPLYRSACTMMFRKPVPKWTVNGGKHIMTTAVEIVG